MRKLTTHNLQLTTRSSRLTTRKFQVPSSKLREEGQTLIETVVSLVILSTIMGLTAIAAFTSVRRASQASVRTQATFLAQEAMEVVKNYKDRNWGLSERDANPGRNSTGGDYCYEPPSNCLQPIVGPLDDPGEYFLDVLGNYCLSFDGATRKWFLTTPSGIPDTCTTSGTLGGAGGNFIRYVNIVTDSAGHTPSTLVLPTPNCPAGYSVDNCFIKKVTVTVKWCPDSLNNVGGCTDINRDKVELKSYFYKWKDPNVG